MTQKLIVITGITGFQGFSVANAFLSSPYWKIRGLTRSPTSARAQSWISRGVEIVQADIDDPATLIPAFTGAHAIFAMTDYWYPIRTPSVQNQAQERGISKDEICAEIEVKRGKNMAIAASSPEVMKTLERFVWSSLPDVTKLSGGKYTKVWHFDSKAQVERFIREDRGMMESGLAARASFVHVGLYVDNWRRSGAEIQKDERTGGYVHVSMEGGKKKLPFVWAGRDTGVVVKKLVEDVEPGVRVLAVSQEASYREYMATWAKVLGKVLGGDEGIKRVSEKEFREMLPPDEDIRDHLMETWKYFEEFGYDGGDEKMLYPKDIGAQHLVSSLEDYIKQEDWSALFQKESSILAKRNP